MKRRPVAGYAELRQTKVKVKLDLGRVDFTRRAGRGSRWALGPDVNIDR